MDLREIGNTDLQVSELALGTWQYRARRGASTGWD